MTRRFFAAALAFASLVCVSAFAEESVTIQLENVDQIAKHGNLNLPAMADEIRAVGIECGDLANVSFLGQDLILPVGSNYSDVDSGMSGLFLQQGGAVRLASNMASFAETYGIAVKTVKEDKSYYWTPCEGVEFPIDIEISLNEKKGYYEEYVNRSVVYTQERADYPNLTDEEFANFRMIDTTGMGEARLYRSCTPVNPAFLRCTYADAAYAEAGVTVIMNLADDEQTLTAYEGYADTYYSTVDHIALNLGMDMNSEDFRASLADGLRYFAENEGVYAVHCKEGKDRAGFVSAVLECLMGASAEEVVADYMTTYVNYYGLTEDDVRWTTISETNIVRSLQTQFGVADIYTADLSAAAEGYVLGIGLTEEELAALKDHLAA